MPTYQYRCTACAEPVEVVQSFTDAALEQCPTCGGALRKVFSAVGVVFKGSGFYQTDSRAKPKAEPAAKPAGSDKEPAAPAAAGSDGKKADPAKPAAVKPAKKDAAAPSSHKVA